MENKRLVLKMLEEGKITAEEAIKLLNSLNDESKESKKESTINEDFFNIDFEDSLKKLEETLKKIEPAVEKTFKESLLKMSELSKMAAEKMGNKDSKDDEK